MKIYSLFISKNIPLQMVLSAVILLISIHLKCKLKKKTYIKNWLWRNLLFNLLDVWNNWTLSKHFQKTFQFWVMKYSTTIQYNRGHYNYSYSASKVELFYFFHDFNIVFHAKLLKSKIIYIPSKLLSIPDFRFLPLRGNTESS